MGTQEISTQNRLLGDIAQDPTFGSNLCIREKQAPSLNTVFLGNSERLLW